MGFGALLTIRVRRSDIAWSISNVYLYGQANQKVGQKHANQLFDQCL